MAFESWNPPGRGAVLHDNILGILAEKYNKSITQKSITPSRIEQNSEVYDFRTGDHPYAIWNQI